MATFKKTAKKTTRKTTKKTTSKSAPRRKTAKVDSAAGEKLAKSISESAQQIWLAGVGAFGRAQAEGTRLFEGLVKEGLGLEKTAREFANARASTVRNAVESSVGQTRDRAADTWDRLEKVFEDRVQRALVKLGVPGRDDVQALSARVDALTEALQQATGTAAKPARKPAAKKAAKSASADVAKPTRKRAAKKAPAAPAQAPATEAPATDSSAD